MAYIGAAVRIVQKEVTCIPLKCSDFWISLLCFPTFDDSIEHIFSKLHRRFSRHVGSY